MGKESDIYLGENDKGEYVVLKLARLGRTSFRTIKKNRDYIRYRSQFNWLYLSRYLCLLIKYVDKLNLLREYKYNITNINLQKYSDVCLF